MPKAIVFDFGNVLYDLNFNLFYHNISELLNLDLAKGFPLPLIKIIEQYDSGLITTQDFISEINLYKGQFHDPELIVKVWNSLLSGFPPHRWEFLTKLRPQFKIYILSNINELHFKAIQKHIIEEHEILNFEKTYFDDVFYSHLIHMIKPNEDIYSYVQKKIGIKGSDILFIDDKEENILAAKKFGWKARLHDPENDIARIFGEYLKENL